MIEDSPLTSTLTSTSLREALLSFWNGSLAIEPHREGFLFTMPASFPDGWQIVLEITQKTPMGFRLSDRGATLAWLAGQGQSVDTENMKRHIHRLCLECGMQLEGGEFVRWLAAPLEATGLHVFTEGLIGVSQLHLFHEHRMAEENVAERVVQRVFQDAGITPARNHKLNITKERQVAVDFYVEAPRPVALELIKTKNELPATMERWGFRWDELKKNYRNLMPVMLYDRNTLLIDPYSRHIGEEKCELFCGYDETDRIHELLEKAR